MIELFNPRSIGAAVVIITMTTGALLLMSSRQKDGERSLLTWGISNVIGGMGAAMLIARGMVPDVISIVTAYALMITAYLLNLAGVLQFSHRRVPWALLALPPVAWLLLCQFPAFTTSVQARLTFVSGMVTIVSFCAAATLLRLRDEILPTRLPAVIWYGFHGSVFCMLFFLPLFIRQSAPNEVAAGALIVLVMMEALVHVTMTSFLLLSLIKDRAEGRYRRAAETDVLTAQPNRRAFMATAQQLVADPNHWPACMLVIDIDRFKSINDTAGHAGGDAVLVKVAETIRAHLRPTDTFGRLGGEEFGALLPNTTLASASVIAEGLRARVARLEILAGDITLRATVSIGVSVIAGGKPDLDHLIDRADACLYEAKRTGRNRVVAREDGHRIAG